MVSSVVSGLSFWSYLRPIEAAICWEKKILYHIKLFPFMQCLCNPHTIPGRSVYNLPQENFVRFLVVDCFFVSQENYLI